jgi:hypothetical protein
VFRHSAILPVPALPATQQLSLGALAHHCAAETRASRRAPPHETRFAYELFRRALAERDNAAWEYVYELFAPMVERWVRRSSAFERSSEGADYFEGAAFTRFWRAIGLERFPGFATLGALLLYLRRCAECVVIDNVRAQGWAIKSEGVVDHSETRAGVIGITLTGSGVKGGQRSANSR